MCHHQRENKFLLVFLDLDGWDVIHATIQVHQFHNSHMVENFLEFGCRQDVASCNGPVLSNLHGLQKKSRFHHHKILYQTQIWYFCFYCSLGEHYMLSIVEATLQVFRRWCCISLLMAKKSRNLIGYILIIKVLRMTYAVVI